MSVDLPFLFSFEIWSHIFHEWCKIKQCISDVTPMDFFTIAKFHYRDIHICNFFLRKLVNIQPVMWFKIKPLRTHDVICQKKYFLILEKKFVWNWQFYQKISFSWKCAWLFRIIAANYPKRWIDPFVAAKRRDLLHQTRAKFDHIPNNHLLWFLFRGALSQFNMRLCNFRSDKISSIDYNIIF